MPSGPRGFSYFRGVKAQANDIPIRFEWKGKEYNGIFRPVMSAGTVYHLMIDNRYHGQLVKTERQGWQFHSQKGSFADWGEFFGSYITGFVG